MTEFKDSLTDWFNSIYPVIIEFLGDRLQQKNYDLNHLKDLRRVSDTFFLFLNIIDKPPPSLISLMGKEEVNQNAWSMKISIGRLLKNHEYRVSRRHREASEKEATFLPPPSPCFSKEFYLNLLIGSMETLVFFCACDAIIQSSVATAEQIEGYEPFAPPVGNIDIKRMILQKLDRLRTTILSISANWKLFELYLDMNVMARFLYGSIYHLYNHFTKYSYLYTINQETTSEKEQSSVPEIPSFGHTSNVSDRKFPMSSDIRLMLELHQDLWSLALFLQEFVKNVEAVTEDEVGNEPVLPLNRYYENYVQKLKLHELYKERHGRFADDIAEHGINLEKGFSIISDTIIDVKARLFHGLHQINRILIFNIQKMRDFINKKNANINRRDRVVVNCLPVEEVSLTTCYKILREQGMLIIDRYLPCYALFDRNGEDVTDHISFFTNFLYDDIQLPPANGFEISFIVYIRVLITSIGVTKRVGEMFPEDITEPLGQNAEITVTLLR